MIIDYRAIKDAWSRRAANGPSDGLKRVIDRPRR